MPASLLIEHCAVFSILFRLDIKRLAIYRKYTLYVQKFSTVAEGTFSNVQTGQFYKSCPQFGKDIIENERECFL